MNTNLDIITEEVTKGFAIVRYSEGSSFEVPFDDLEQVFHECQNCNPNGSWINSKEELRSMSVGDVVKTSKGFFLCDTVGWKSLSKNQVKKLDFIGRRDLIMGYEWLLEQLLLPQESN